MYQVASTFGVVRFLNMCLSWSVVGEEIISQHYAIAECFSCMHNTNFSDTLASGSCSVEDSS